MKNDGSKVPPLLILRIRAFVLVEVHAFQK
jgi:hypothetical protein